jgi:nitroreductase
VELVEAIYERRSIRRFRNEPVERDDLEALLDAARWAPNGGNRNAWRFIVVTSEAQKKLVLSFAPGIEEPPGAIIVICMEAKSKVVREPLRLLNMADAAIAAQNMCLAAHGLGLGSYIVLSFAGAALQPVLDLPDNVSPYLLVCVGHPDEAPDRPPRRPIEEIAYVDEYGRGWGQ